MNKSSKQFYGILLIIPEHVDYQGLLSDPFVRENFDKVVSTDLVYGGTYLYIGFHIDTSISLLENSEQLFEELIEKIEQHGLTSCLIQSLYEGDLRLSIPDNVEFTTIPKGISKYSPITCEFEYRQVLREMKKLETHCHLVEGTQAYSDHLAYSLLCDEWVKSNPKQSYSPFESSDRYHESITNA